MPPSLKSQWNHINIFQHVFNVYVLWVCWCFKMGSYLSCGQQRQQMNNLSCGNIVGQILCVMMVPEKAFFSVKGSKIVCFIHNSTTHFVKILIYNGLLIWLACSFALVASLLLFLVNIWSPLYKWHLHEVLKHSWFYCIEIQVVGLLGFSSGPLEKLTAHPWLNT